MESIMTWAKENFDLITLIVAFAGVLVGVISLMVELKKKKKEKEKKEKKQEQP